MKRIDRALFNRRGSIKPLACLTLALSAVSISSIATAGTLSSPIGDLAWCQGDSKPDALTYKNIPGYPAATLPFGFLSTKNDPRNGLNPADTWDKWQSGPFNNPPIGDKLETGFPYKYPAMANDNYAVQMNYWNSQSNSVTPGTANDKSPFGHSPGRLCMTYTDYTDSTTDSVTGLQFTISYPADASQPNSQEVAFLTSNPKEYPNFAPFKDGITVGGPTSYVSAFKGCSWDANSCTRGSVIPGKGESVEKKSDINKFPEKLSDITSIPTSWSIDADYNFGNPFEESNHPANLKIVNGQNVAVPQIWDASWDIWFDKTAHTAEGEAPYNQDNQTHDARGQNDGLEIMVWMNSKGSYVDDYDGKGQPHGVAGKIQPTGSIREQVNLDGVLYDVWVGRLNNPNFGYANDVPMPNGTMAPPIIKPTEIPGKCPTTIGKKSDTAAGRQAAILCGVEWNVVSFVATKSFASGPGGSGVRDYRRNTDSINAKIFTDYLLGFDRHPRAPSDPGAWYVTLEADANGMLGAPTSNRKTNHLRLQCPASNKEQGIAIGPDGKPKFGGDFGTTDCLDPSWYLMSVQAGFETWSGGNGLRTNKFRAYVNTEATVLADELDPRGYPIVPRGMSADVVYEECKSVNTNNKASLTITGKNSAGASAVIGPYDLLPQLYNGRFQSWPGTTDLVGDALITITSNCGKTAYVPIVIRSTAPGLTITQTVNGADWQNGYCRNLVIRNNNPYPVKWSIDFYLPFPGNITQKWNFDYSKSGNLITAKGLASVNNDVVQPYQTLKDQGYCATK